MTAKVGHEESHISRRGEASHENGTNGSDVPQRQRNDPRLSRPIPLEHSSSCSTSLFQSDYLRKFSQIPRLGDPQNQITNSGTPISSHYGSALANTRVLSSNTVQSNEAILQNIRNTRRAVPITGMSVSHSAENTTNFAPCNANLDGHENGVIPIISSDFGSLVTENLSIPSSSQTPHHRGRGTNIQKYISHTISRICGLLFAPQLDDERRMSVIRKIKRLCDSLPHRLDLVEMINDTFISLSSSHSTYSTESNYENTAPKGCALVTQRKRVRNSDNVISGRHADVHSRPISLPWPVVITDSLDARYRLDDVYVDYMLNDVISSLGGMDIKKDISRYDTEYTCTYNHNLIQPHWSSRSRILAEGFDICSVFVNLDYERRILREVSDRTSYASQSAVKAINIPCESSDQDIQILLRSCENSRLNDIIQTSISITYQDSSDSLPQMQSCGTPNSNGKSDLITYTMISEFLMLFFGGEEGVIIDRNPLYTGPVHVTVDKQTVRALSLSLSTIGRLIIDALVQQRSHITSGVDHSRQDLRTPKHPLSVHASLSHSDTLGIHSISLSNKMCLLQRTDRTQNQSITVNHMFCIFQRSRRRQTRFHRCPYSTNDNAVDLFPAPTVSRFLEVCEEYIENAMKKQFPVVYEA